MNPRVTEWTPEMDRKLESMWQHFPSWEIADALGLNATKIEYRAEKLKLPVRIRRLRFEPPESAWVDAATFFARQEDVLPQMVLSGHRTPGAVTARRKAIAYVLRTYPRVTFGGLARVSGFDLDTIARAARIMGFVRTEGAPCAQN